VQPPPPDWWDGWGTDGQPITNGDTTLAGQPVYNPINFTKTTTPSRSSAVCLKCHSSYAFGDSPPSSNNGRPSIPNWANGLFSAVAYNDFSIGGGKGCTSKLGAGTPGSALVQAAPMGCVAESDIANEFNPNNLAHHAVFAPGKNQPLVSSDTLPSTYNPNWPKFVSDTTTNVKVTIQNGADGKGIVTLTGPAGTTWPITTLPGWFLYIGSSAPAQKSTGWYQVAASTDPTHLTLDRSAAGVAGTGKDFMLTPGLAATFVPPWGPWSTLKCTDCHASDAVGAPAGAADPFGPHGSGQKWLLRDYKGKIYPFFAKSGFSSLASQFVSISNTSVNDADTGQLPGTNTTVLAATKTNFCLNCHRFEVYSDNYVMLGELPNGAGNYSRTSDHNGGSHYLNPVWGIGCLTCHGGSRMGGIHGSNLGKGHTYREHGGTYGAGSYSGKRLLNGATLVGHTRASTSAAGTCFFKSAQDSVAACAHPHPTDGDWRNYAYTSKANYDYEGGADP